MKRKVSDVEEDYEFDGEDRQEEGKVSSQQLNANGVAEILAQANNNAFKLFLARNNEFYIAYGKDALFLANDFHGTMQILSKLPSPPGEYVNIRPQSLEKLLKFVIFDQSRAVEIYARNGDNWVLDKKASPGNLQNFENILFSDPSRTQSSIILALNVQGTHVAAAFVDTVAQVMYVSEFIDNENFADLESFLFQVGAKECLINLDDLGSGIDTASRLQTLFEKCGIHLIETKKSEYKANFIEQDLSRLLTSVESNLEALELKRALGALNCVLKHLDMLRDDSLGKKFNLKVFNLSQYMKLDSSAVKALNLIPSSMDSSKNCSLYGLLNQCKTAMGSRMLLKWIKQPLRDVESIETRQNLVELFIDENETRCALHDEHLKRIPDLDKTYKKLQGSKAGLKDVVGIYFFSIRLPLIIDCLKSVSSEYSIILNERFTSKLSQISANFSKFEELVELTIDLKAVDNHEYIVKAEFAPQLKELGKTKSGILSKMESLRNEVADEINLEEFKLKLNHAANHGHHFRITRKEETKIRGRSEFISLETRKDGVRFTTRPMMKLSTQLKEVTQQYNEIQHEVVNKIIELTRSYTPLIEEASVILAELDVLISLGVVAASAPGSFVKPRILSEGSGVLEFREARHPCMEAQDGFSFIPNDIVLEPDSRFQVITGPNMGGKSTYIRTVGVLCLMSQIGSFIPCQSARVSVVDRILARVGAGDNQMRGVSTFMAEMLEAASILSGATSNSLVIVDELGRGTSTYDGFGLAWAISEHIAEKIKSFTLFATHFQELTVLEHHASGVVNKHVTAQTLEGSITMLYQVKDGPSDQSFGIHVAELANFPKPVIEMARAKAIELERFESEGLGFGTQSDDATLNISKTTNDLISGLSTDQIQSLTMELERLQCENLPDIAFKSNVEQVFQKYGVSL